MKAVGSQFAWGSPEMYEAGCYSGRVLAHTDLAVGIKRKSASSSRCLAGRLQAIVASLLFFAGLKASAQTSVTLAWDASTSSTVVGYKLYYGVASRLYTNAINVGATNISTIAGLTSGTRYFFAATAVDNLGQESAYSTETNYIPGATGNTAPFISAIANQSVSLDTPTPALSFTVGDAETPASSLTVTGGSDNTGLVDQTGIVFGGSAGSRTVTVTPLLGASGSATITLTVSDGTNTANTSFLLSVNNSRPVNTPPTITSIAGQFIAQDTVAGPIAFTVSDTETAATSLIVTAGSSDQTLVPDASIALGGSGASRTVTVTPATGQLGTATITLTVSDGTASTNTSFVLTVQATTFTPAAASYSGLFYDSNQVAYASAGSFKVSTTTKSKYTGQFKHQGKTYSVSGQLDAFGRGSNSIPRTGLSPLVLLFDCGTSNYSGTLFGTLSGAGWVASVSGDRLSFNAKTNPAPWAGTYTLVLPGQEGTDGPAGHSYGAVKVTTAGAVSFAGSLGDGVKVSQAASLSKEGMWPFYASLYSSKGLIISWLTVSNNPSANIPDVGGLASWIKLADPLSKVYPAGFTNQCNAAGAVYLKPATITQHVIHVNTARVSFAGGNLLGAFTNDVDIIASSKVVNGSTNLMSMSFNLSSGTFSGHVLDPYSKKSKSFGGVVLQKFTAGYGMLMGTNQTSQVEVTP
jgi:hypothetical protein